jgi:hypothetical protein
MQMLHVVQVVMWGVAETPQLFLDEAKARSAYVECARKHWAQRYAAYCEHHDASVDCFASAQAFVNTIDVSEKSAINYWTLNPEEAGLGDAELCGPGPEEFRQVAEGIVAVKEGLTRLLDDVSHLTDRCARLAVEPVEAQTVEGPGKTAPSPSAVPEEEPESAPETYTTAEWKTFAGTIKRLCSGSRNEFYLLPRDNWRQAVYSNRTSLEYWDWLADRIVKYKENAKSAGFSVIEEPDSPGYYKFTNREGIASEDCYDSEWEAWCAAGLHLEGT